MGGFDGAAEVESGDVRLAVDDQQQCARCGSREDVTVVRVRGGAEVLPVCAECNAGPARVGWFAGPAG